MRNKTCMLFLLVVFNASITNAQNKKVIFHSINSFGFIIGEKSDDLQIQSVNGVAYKNFFSGIGFGKDDYSYDSYPLFLDQRIYFGKRNNGFAYGNVGYNLTAKNKPGKEVYYYNSYHFSNGVYTDFGFGHKMKLAKKTFFILSAGFSYKDINYKIGVINPCLTAFCTVDYSNYKYGNGRVVLKAGVDF